MKNLSEHLCDTCSGEECHFIFNGPKIIGCPAYTGPVDGGRRELDLIGASVINA